MNGSPTLFVACLLSAASLAASEAPVPADSSIKAHVVRTLAAPPEQAMRMPTDVAVDTTGRVYVADGVNDRIVRFDREGRFEGFITAPGYENLSRPIGLSVDATNRLWITDTGRHRLVVLSANGGLTERIDLPKAENGGPVDPTDVAVTTDGKRTYVVDNDGHRILVRDNDTGEFIELGRFGTGLGQLQWPFMIDIDPEGYVYVSEVIGARVQRMNPAGRWAGQISQRGVELGRVYRPKGVAIDQVGRVYVGDSTLGVVQVFGPRGNVLGVLTDAAGAPLRFQHPMGMCFDPDGRLYVVELRANQVAVVQRLVAPASVSGERENQTRPEGNR